MDDFAHSNLKQDFGSPPNACSNPRSALLAKGPSRTTAMSGASRDPHEAIASPAFVDRLDRGTSTTVRCEQLARHTSESDASAVIDTAVKLLVDAADQRKVSDPLLALHLRRLLRLSVNAAATSMLAALGADKAAIACLIAVPPEKFTSPPYAAECVHLLLTFLLVRVEVCNERRADVLRSLAEPAALGALFATLRLAAVLGLFPTLAVCMRLFTPLYNRHAAARMLARDKNLPGIVSDLNRRHAAVPASVSVASLELLTAMSQWIPRRRLVGAGQGGTAGVDATGSPRTGRLLTSRTGDTSLQASASFSSSASLRADVGSRASHGPGAAAAATARAHGKASAVGDYSARKAAGGALSLSPIRAIARGLPPPLLASADSLRGGGASTARSSTGRSRGAAVSGAALASHVFSAASSIHNSASWADVGGSGGGAADGGLAAAPTSAYSPS